MLEISGGQGRPPRPLKSVTIPGEAAETPLQQLLGVCNRNPIFTLQRDRAGGRLLLFYGAELLESFPEDPEHFSLRLCAGRLYNAGLPRKALSKAFDPAHPDKSL
jgi:hypothetical protein